MRSSLLIGQEHTNQLVDEQAYLDNMEKLYSLLQEADALRDLEAEFPLIREIISELENIYSEGVKNIFKKFMTPKMVSLILGRHYNLFLFDEQKTVEFE